MSINIDYIFQEIYFVFRPSYRSSSNSYIYKVHIEKYYLLVIVLIKIT